MGSARLLLLGRFKNAASIPSRLFSSSAALIRRRSSIHHSEGSDGESALYKRALKLQRPTTIEFRKSLFNSVSLIGTIELHFKECNTDKFGVHTRLKVKASGGPYAHHRVLLKFWDEMAEMSVQHLKPDDFIYVSGYLSSYVQVDEDGKSTRNYEVNVTEVNFVAKQGLGPACQNSVKLEPKVSYEDMMQMHRNRLHLWQIFFANPSEWWDNRKCKTKPIAPDFKHKDTGEALWLKDTDPPWIKKQLELHHSRLSKRSPGERRNCLSRLSPLVYDD
ncbi:hypothetical protein BUALT_Bualt08G0055400 [Buddleja alternifolia]|uniref:Uncharacterized protein n=1 Tax=Buddleja alternifolia TaxID=168488 RepID=A0AAV6X407_9LAMI|nr:hypothetical protein BUALT_Bualt08G0055400 [Buddleja alternifolia]